MVKKLKKELTRKDFQKWGKKAGAINKKKGTKYFSEMGLKSALVRWGYNKTK